TPSSGRTSTEYRCREPSSPWSRRRRLTPTCAAPATTRQRRWSRSARSCKRLMTTSGALTPNPSRRRPEVLVLQTLDKLSSVGLGAMAAALRDQLENPAQYLELSFEDRLGLLVDTDWRENRRLATRLKPARLRHPATVEDIDFRAPRGLDRGMILSLAQAGWVTNHQNLLVTGATGCGKSFLACALAHAAVRQGHTALYVRTPRLLDDLAVSRGDGRYQRLLAQLQRTSLLVLDDFLLTPAGVEQCRDLLEVVEDRAQLRSTLVASQLPIDAWHGAMADPTLAEAILDRLLHQGHRITVKGPSMRARDPDGAVSPAPSSAAAGSRRGGISRGPGSAGPAAHERTEGAVCEGGWGKRPPVDKQPTPPTISTTFPTPPP